MEQSTKPSAQPPATNQQNIHTDNNSNSLRNETPPSNTHSWAHHIQDEDGEEDEEEEEEEDELWRDINPSSPASLRHPRTRSHRIPSITLINPAPELVKLASNSLSTSSSPFITEITNSHSSPPQSPRAPATHPSLNLPHPTTTPTEEWRSKILNSVRIGEERVAQRRKQSSASLLPTQSPISPCHPPANISSASTPQQDPQPSSSNQQPPPSDIQSILPNHPPSVLPDPSQKTHIFPSDLKGKLPLTHFHQIEPFLQPTIPPVHPTGSPSSGSSTQPISTALPSDSSQLSSISRSDAAKPSKPLSTNNPYLDLLERVHQPQPQTGTHSDTPALSQTPPATRDPSRRNPKSHGSTVDLPKSIPSRPSSSPPSTRHPHQPNHGRSNSSNLVKSATHAAANTSMERSNSNIMRTNYLPTSTDHPLQVLQPMGSHSAALAPNDNLDEPPPPVDGTFITVVEPDLSSRLTLVTSLHDSPSSTSPQPNPAVGNAAPNQLSDFLPQPSTIRSSSATRSKTGKRHFFSTLLQRAAGSNSGPNSPAPSPSAGIMSRNPFDSTANRTANSSNSDNTRVGNNRSGFDHHHSSPNLPSDGTDSDRGPSPGKDLTLYATASTLASMSLNLTPLTPHLPASRNSQPLCGAILDEKYLLIGTNNGLDFVPLAPSTTKSSSGLPSCQSSIPVTTIKPISLIKKTRFKVLKVLEVRSNILLAIAGRNDHLRVYALDGIRAIIAKKLQDLEERDQVVWFPKSLARGAPSKGKERVQAQPATTHSPQYSPPPPYGGSNLGLEQTMIKSNSAQPVSASAIIARGTPSSISTNLRRSSTLGSRIPNPSGMSAPQAAADPRRSSFHSASDPLPYISPNGIDAAPALQTQRLESSDLFSQNSGTRRSNLLHDIANSTDNNHPHQTPNPDDHGMPIGDHQENPRPSCGSTDTPDQDNSRPPHGSADTPDCESSSGNGDRSVTGRALVDLIRKRSQQLGTSVKPTSNLAPALPCASRLVPRSALAASGTNQSSDNNQLDLAHVLSSNLTSSPAISISSSTPNSILPPLAAPGNDARLAINIIEDVSQPDAEPLSGSSSNPRPLGQTPDPSARGKTTQITNSSPSGLSSQVCSRVPSAANHSDQESQTGTNLTIPVKSKKRWSVMDSVFRTHSHSSSNYPATGSSVFAAAAQLASRSSTDDSLTSRSLSSNRPAENSSAESNAQHNLRARMSTQKLRSNVSGTHSELIGGNTISPTGGGASAGNSGANVNGSSSSTPISTGLLHRGEFEDQPRERLATHFHGQSTAETAKTSPHPATLGAPLEYVKLARTKGAKLLRAFETKRRTYLAVLCGESSERIELFTGSKNISLSLNRTFVLPETPRTIEFQMQGDDLVDIYLVYDESVFALEPATVRVREVGIGRNERRAARRERERAVRDLASINMRPALVGNGSGNSDGVEAAQGSLAETPESLVEAMELAQRTTSSLVPPSVDDGLTLSVPISSFRPNPAANSSGLASVWGAHEAHVGAGNLNGGPVKMINMWPYTTFQQLGFIPPLPPSVLASTFVIPPTYEAVVTAGGGPKSSMIIHSNNDAPNDDSSRILSPINVLEPGPDNLMIPLNVASDRLSSRSSSSVDVEGGVGGNPAREASPTNQNPANIELSHAMNTSTGRSSDSEVELSSNGGDPAQATIMQQGEDSSNRDEDNGGQRQTILSDGPLLSPISLLANPQNRQIGPPGLFLATRGKKVTSIVDCDGRSVMKKPFIWTNDKNSKPISNNSDMSGSANNGNYGFRIEVIIANDNRTILVGIDNLDVKIFQVGGLYPAKGLEDFSNSATLDIIPSVILNPNNPNHNHINNGVVGGGSGVGIITAQSFNNPSTISAPHHHLFHPNLHISGLASLSIGLGSATGLGSGMGSNTTASTIATTNEVSTISGTGPNGNSNTNHGGTASLADREIVFLASSASRNQVIWSERSNGCFVVYSLASHSSFSIPFLQPASDS